MSEEFRRSTTMAVLEAVADETGVEITDLAPLYEAVEPTALNRLCEHGFDGRMTFRYEGCDVTVTGDGAVTVRQAE